ncbi:MAG: 4Fe-4S dicluster domain-containing protein [Bacteroidia bacterium]|nr:4Fe-4S dicluster domain-containing protein [Bacteroidia bacterium]
MAAINPEFGKELKKYGAFDFNACYNCGNCTAVCSLSTEEDSFPREMLRFSVLGLKDDIKSSLKPWLCYYCGECSTHCPQTANPGELMMSLRRWLTSEYDWTKLSGLLYRSLSLTIIAFIITAVGVITFSALENFNLKTIMHFGHNFEMIAIASVFGLILFPNIVRMWWFIILKPKIKAPLSKYLAGLWELILHMFTQKRALDCDDNRFRWFEHFILVLGYLGLLFTTVFLDWFSSEKLFIIVFGYVVSITVFIVTIDFVSDRIKKSNEISKFSQPSDWLFVIWLFLMGITAFSVRLFIDIGLIENNIWLYLFHFIILVQWALIIVPFGKWTHFLYRSFAMYFAKIKS